MAAALAVPHPYRLNDRILVLLVYSKLRSMQAVIVGCSSVEKGEVTIRKRHPASFCKGTV